MVAIEKIAKILKLLGDSSRLSIIFAIEDGEKSVSQIMDATKLSQPLVSFHLRALRDAGLIVAERKGTLVLNSLADPELPNSLRQLRKYTSESNAESSCFPFCGPPWMRRE